MEESKKEKGEREEGRNVGGGGGKRTLKRYVIENTNRSSSRYGLFSFFGRKTSRLCLQSNLSFFFFIGGREQRMPVGVRVRGYENER